VEHPIDSVGALHARKKDLNKRKKKLRGFRKGAGMAPAQNKGEPARGANDASTARNAISRGGPTPLAGLVREKPE